MTMALPISCSEELLSRRLLNSHEEGTGGYAYTSSHTVTVPKSHCSDGLPANKRCRGPVRRCFVMLGIAPAERTSKPSRLITLQLNDAVIRDCL